MTYEEAPYRGYRTQMTDEQFRMLLDVNMYAENQFRREDNEMLLFVEGYQKRVLLG